MRKSTLTGPVWPIKEDIGHFKTWTPEQIGAYWLLIAAFWKEGHPIPDDNSLLSKITRTYDRWETDFRPILEPRFVMQGAHWRHPYFEQEYAGALKRRSIWQEAAIRTNQKRWEFDEALDTKYRTLFEEWWKHYPRAPGRAYPKHPAYLAYVRAVKSGRVTHEQLKDAVRIAAQTDLWQKENMQYIPHPSTFLNQRRYEDFLEQRPLGNGKSSAKGKDTFQCGGREWDRDSAGPKLSEFTDPDEFQKAQEAFEVWKATR